jgi:hypothetical protein
MDFLDPLFQSSEIEVPFGAEVEINGSLGNAGGLGDIVHGCVTETLVGEYFTGGIQDLATAEFRDGFLLCTWLCHETDSPVILRD